MTTQGVLQMNAANVQDQELNRLLADADRWGPEGDMGNQANHATPATAEDANAVNDALGLQMISIRLQRGLLQNLKLIADHHGIGYQPMIRDLLNRFVRSEIRDILRDLMDAVEQQAPPESTPPVEEFMRKRAA